MALKKPNRPAQNVPSKGRRVWRAGPDTWLDRAMSEATYLASPYHCTGDKGERPKWRGKPASICDRWWGVEEATAALRRALRLRNVCECPEGDFPRYVWYRAGTDLVYEARLSGGRPGTYHAYPIEADQVPKDVRS